jgi:hypothetical protein
MLFKKMYNLIRFLLAVVFWNRMAPSARAYNVLEVIFAGALDVTPMQLMDVMEQWPSDQQRMRNYCYAAMGIQQALNLQYA